MKLDNILKSFHKTLDHLDQYLDQQSKAISKNEQKMAEITADNFQRRSDYQRAEKARKKINELIGDS